MRKKTDCCLEIEEVKVTMSDECRREIIKKKFGIETVKIGDQMRKKQDHLLKDLKLLDGISIRQIVRITGLLQTRVWKV